MRRTSLSRTFKVINLTIYRVAGWIIEKQRNARHIESAEKSLSKVTLTLKVRIGGYKLLFFDLFCIIIISIIHWSFVVFLYMNVTFQNISTGLPEVDCKVMLLIVDRYSSSLYVIKIYKYIFNPCYIAIYHNYNNSY
mgnify:CR=1 FL=1